MGSDHNNAVWVKVGKQAVRKMFPASTTPPSPTFHGLRAERQFENLATRLFSKYIVGSFLGSHSDVLRVLHVQ